MKKCIHLLPIISISVALFPLMVNAQTTTDVNSLIAQTQALIAQINALQTQQGTAANTSMNGTTNTTPGTCPSLSRTLSLGASGTDVSSLQQFLAQDPSVYPQRIVSGYFGALTQSAVQRWQAKSGIVSSGTPASTGYGVVGPHTKSVMLASCTLGTGGTPSVVSGFVQITPASGSAPLSATVTVTVNSSGSCIATTYTVDFGDGSAKQTISTAGNCSQVVQTYTHVYQYGGIYQVTLSSGSHQTSASVTVNGSSTQTQTATSSLSVSVSGTQVAQGGTLPISWQSQNAPSSAAVGLWLVNLQTGTLYPIALISNTSGTLNAPIPSTASQGTVSPVGVYEVVAKLYTPADALLTNTTPTYVALAQSGSFNIGTPVSATNGSYSILAVSIGIGGDQSASSLQISYPACASYVVDWGDGNQTQANASTGGCSTPGNVTLYHTYLQNGTVTLRLNDGNGVQQSTVSLTIAQAGTIQSYGITSLNLSVGSNPLNVSAQLTVPVCPTYTLNWGDGTTPTSQSPGANCSGSGALTPTFNHTYSKGGPYLVKLLDAGSTVDSSSSIFLATQ